MSSTYGIEYPAPGAVRITWARKGAFGHSLIWGEKADDLLERLRAAPDEEHRQLILQHEVEGMG
jgi:hypothetical protein